MKLHITLADYNKIIRNDLVAFNELCQNPKYFEDFQAKYLDQSTYSDAIVMEAIQEDKMELLREGKVADYIALNAFHGAIKKINTKKRKS